MILFGIGIVKLLVDCRKYVFEFSYAFRVWVWIFNDSDEEDMRETCLFYDIIVLFVGCWDDKVYVIGCIDRKFFL